MSRNARPRIPATSRTTVPVRRARRSEAGDTLVEVLLALIILGMASVALLIAFGTSISASAEHRNIAEYNTLIATATQEATALIDGNSSLFVDACSTPITGYPDYASGFPLPSPYQSFHIGYVSLNAATGSYPVQYWNGSSYVPSTWNTSTLSYPSPCADNQPQLITIGFTAGGETYTNSFVAEYPVTQKNNFSGDSTSRQLSFLNSSTVGYGYAGTPLTVQPIIEVEDANGVAVTSDLSPVTMSLVDLNGAQGTLSGCQGNEVLAVVTFTGCTVSSGGSGQYELIATDGSLTTLASSPFTIQSSQYSLEFTSGVPLAAQPVAGASGSPFQTVPQVAVYVTNTLSTTPTIDKAWNGTVTFTDSGGSLSNCPSYTVSSSPSTTVTEVVSNGVAALPSTCDFSGGYFFIAASSPQVTATL